MKIIQTNRGTDFLLRDKTGNVRVQTWNLRAHVENGIFFTSGMYNNPSSRLEKFLKDHRQSSKGWFLNKKLRYHESILEAGQTVAALGLVKLDKDPALPLGSRESSAQPARRLVLGPPPGGQVILSNASYIRLGPIRQKKQRRKSV